MNSYDNGCEGYGVVFCYQTHLMDFTTHPFPLGNGSNADDVHVEATISKPFTFAYEFLYIVVFLAVVDVLHSKEHPTSLIEMFVSFIR